MKKSLLFLMLLLATAMSGQVKLLFKYDDAGNQKKREICFGDCQVQERPAAQNKSMAEVTDEDLLEFSDDISYYPNPVKEELYVKWKLAGDKNIASIDVFTINGQLLSSIKIKEGENIRSIYFGNYPVGNYLLLLNFNNGQQETLQVIKK